MKRGMLFVSIWLGVTWPAAAQSKVFEETVRLAPGGLLRLDASRGSVRLTGWDRDQVEIRARIEADSSWDSEYARRVVEATRIEVQTGLANEVTIRGNYDNMLKEYWNLANWGGKPNIHFEIRAPRRADLRLDIDRSNSVINGFEGRIDLEADRSEIEATDLAGAIRISIDRGGNSSFRNIRGSFNVDADRTNLRIDLARLDSASRIEIDRGNVDMSFPRAQGLDLDTSLSRRADFDTSLSIQGRNFRGNNPSGAVNGGGPRLAIQADRSRITLRNM